MAVYRKYTANSRKGVDDVDGVKRMNVLGDGIYTGDGRDVLRGTLSNGAPQSKYSSRNIKLDGIAPTDGELVLRWAPIFPGSVKLIDGSTELYDDGNGGFVTAPANYFPVLVEDGNGVAWHFVNAAGQEAAGVPEAGTHAVVYGTTRDVHSGDMVAGMNSKSAEDVTFFGLISGLTAASVTVEYAYENDYVPQNDIPLIGVTQEGIDLRAKPRRLAILFSQFAEYVGQKDYNFNIADELKKQAEFQIQLEIDNEVIEDAIGLGLKNDPVQSTYDPTTDLVWYAGNPAGISLRDHYESINDIIASADAKIFAATNKFTGTYLLIGAQGLRYFSMNTSFKPLSSQRFGVGAYVAGEVYGHKVIVTNLITDGSIYVGVNNSEASAILMGMYMPIMATQLLGFADGSMSQGFASLYDIKVINPALVRRIAVLPGVNPNQSLVVNG